MMETMIRKLLKKYENLTNRYIIGNSEDGIGMDEREANVLLFEVFILPLLSFVGIFLVVIILFLVIN
jgi:hypothetical protein